MDRENFNNIVYSAVLIPDVPDYDGDIVSRDKITQLMHTFMKKYRNIDFSHTLNNIDAVILENYQSTQPRDVVIDGEIKTLPMGTWIMAIEINDPAIIEKIKNYELNGLSVTAPIKVEKSKGEENELSNKERVTFADLGEDFEVSHVSIVGNPAVYDAKFFAFKGVEKDDEKKVNPILNIFKTKKSKEGGLDMDEKKLVELVKKSVEEVLAEKEAEKLEAEKAEKEAKEKEAEKAEKSKEDETEKAEKEAKENEKVEKEEEKENEEITALKSQLEETKKELKEAVKKSEVMEQESTKKVEKSVDLGRDAFGRKL